jgi:hypothetical protein
MPPLVLNSPPVAAPVPTAAPPRSGRRLVWLLAGSWAVLLIVHVPAFLCQALDADVSEWDLCARTVRGGGVIYRDALENNLPGMLWLHLLLRPVVGWSTEAFRVVDLGVLAAVVFLLVRWLPAGASGAARLGTAFVLACFYLSTSEWCHCQRDPWMLLPALLALELRRRQIPGSARSSWGFLFRPFLEGLLWGGAFWIKPFVAVPALACWLASARLIGKSRWLAVDGLLLVLGGLAAGAAGCAWLWVTGAWADFWEVMWTWNREYVVHDTSDGAPGLILAGFLIRLSPWLLVHLAAVPLACRDLWRGERGGEESARGLLLSALYAGWLLQAVALQHLFDYVHVPAVLLALAVVCRRAAMTPGTARTALVALLALCVALRLPGLTLQRLGLWDRCLREGSSVELRDRLSLLPRTKWTDLDRVRAFLAGRGLRDGELTCYNMRTLPLYLDLGVRPATRHFLLANEWAIFRRQRGTIGADLAASRQRYFVCDLAVTSWKPGCGPEDDPGFPILFRAGRYAVLALDAPAMPTWMDEHLDLGQFGRAATGFCPCADAGPDAEAIAAPAP